MAKAGLNQKTITLQELITQAQELLQKYGGHPVYLDDPDTGYLLGISLNFCKEGSGVAKGYEEAPCDIYTIDADYCSWET